MSKIILGCKTGDMQARLQFVSLKLQQDIHFMRFLDYFFEEQKKDVKQLILK